MMRAGTLYAAVLLAGCLSQPRTPEPALYDLGIAPAGKAVQMRMSGEPTAARVRASAPSWLDDTAIDTAMYYRLVYIDEMRTLAYAYARWIAPPAELVGQRLRQRLAESRTAADIGLASAREVVIEITLEEFIQVFETPTRSFGRISVQVHVSGMSSEEASFAEQVAAQTPDAQLAYVTTQAQLFQSCANLYKAMGGGWVQEAEKLAGTTPIATPK